MERNGPGSVQSKLPLRERGLRLCPALQGGVAAIQDGAKASDVETFNAAHAALTADSSVQFGLPPAPPPPKTPDWLRNFFEWLGDVLEPVGKFLGWLGSFIPDAPYARALMWIVIAAALAFLVWIIAERLRSGQWRLPSLRTVAPVEADDDDNWVPDAAPARAWLAEADALAAEGRFAEAVHHLLIRSIEDIVRRRPQLVRPALTSREIGAAEAMPSAARRLFSMIAGLVERSLFGGRPVDGNDWTTARAAYADFLQPGAWRA